MARKRKDTPVASAGSAPKEPRTGKENSNAIVGQRVVSATQAQYATTFKFITKYCAENYPDSVDASGKLILPMTQDNLESFLGDMATDRGDGSVKATSTVTGYCTVIKYFYKQAKVRIDGDQADYFKSFHEGYKRVVAKKKEQGLMKNFEGKVAVTYVIYASLAKIALFASQSRSTFSSFVHLF